MLGPIETECVEEYTSPLLAYEIVGLKDAGDDTNRLL